jgi:prepilin-type N-terminal cleavage/methylation domain-containing protein
MQMLRFKNVFQKNQGSTTQSGFTLVEISIVMIIIGLLIGGIFGGMKLVDNANVQKTIQDLKAIESAALTFRDTYRALPGDIRNPNTRIPNCTDTPCVTTGNGNRIIGTAQLVTGAITSTSENFVFWHHLTAANLISLGIRPTTDMQYGEGQPEAPIGGIGYRISNYTGPLWNPPGINTNMMEGTILFGVAAPDVQWDSVAYDTVPCPLIQSIDIKMDDGSPIAGSFLPGNCNNEWPPTLTSTYTTVSGQRGMFAFNLRGL